MTLTAPDHLRGPRLARDPDSIAEADAWACAMIDAGHTVKAIATAMQATPGCIWGRLRRRGVPIEDRQGQHVRCEYAGAVYPSISNAARAAGVQRETIIRHLDAHGHTRFVGGRS